MSLFLEDLGRVQAEAEAALRAQAAAERELARAEGELVREQAKSVRLEEDVERVRDAHEQAVREASELQALASRLPLIEQARDSEKVRADQLAQKLEAAREKLAESSIRIEDLGARVAERDREVARLNGELESSRLIVAAARARVEADRTMMAELERL